MKNIIVVVFLLVPACLFAQDYPDDGLDKIRIVLADRIIQAEIKPVNSHPSPKPDRFYYWYSNNAIHASQGGYSGDLMNGLYNEYYLNKNLRAQGIFKKGLKEGIWKSWKEDGTLNEVITWKNGVTVPENTASLLEKVNIFRKKKKQTMPDTLPKTPR